MRGSRDDLLFSDLDFSTLLEQMKQGLRTEISSLQRERLLKETDNDLYVSFVDRYSPVVAVLYDDRKHALPPQDINIDVRGRFEYAAIDGDEPTLVKGTSITIVIPFEGDGQYFKYRPSAYFLSGIRGNIIGNEVHLNYSGLPQDMSTEALKNKLDQDIKQIKDNLSRLSHDAEVHNKYVTDETRKLIAARRSAILRDETLVESLGIPIKRRPEDSSTYTIPVSRKPPKIEQSREENTSPREPILHETEYNHILGLISRMAIVMERSPKAFYDMDEESIRWQFIVPLNSHYEGMATGETFNYSGKTDILIRFEGKNVFIAECKIWQGAKCFSDTVEQILKYTSWRDTKTAIILFNRNENFSSVLSQIPALIKAHPCFETDLGKRDETSFKYLLHNLQDNDRKLVMTVMAFNIPKK